MTTAHYQRLGDYIELVDERNKDLSINLLLGLSISKEFIPSVANTVGTNMKNYKIIRKNQFACSIMQVRRDKKMPIALLKEFDEAIISQAYPVFQIKNKSVLCPEYLMMWFSRPEFDREACFHAVGGVRGSLEWEDFLNMKLPVPSLEKQNEIVKEYNTVVNRITLNEQLNQKLEETAQALYKHWFVDFNFPITKESCPELVSKSPELEGKPYKASGGEMVYNEELDKEVPVGWEVNNIGDVVNNLGGGTPKTENKKYWDEGSIYWYSPTDITSSPFLFCEEPAKKITELGLDKSSAKLFPPYSIMMTSRATIGKIGINTKKSCTNQGFITLIPNKTFQLYYLVEWLKSNFDNIDQLASGSTFKEISKTDFRGIKILTPKHNLITGFEKKLSSIYKRIELLSVQTRKLKGLNDLLLSKMTKVEIDKEMV